MKEIITLFITIFIILYSILVLASFGISLDNFMSGQYGYIHSTTPYIISTYKNSNMNWFGCLLLTIFVYFINPFWMIPRFFVVIIYFLAHVGRKKDE